MSDNLTISANGCSQERLEAVLQLARGFEHIEAKWEFWKATDSGIVFSRYDGTKLPVPINPGTAAQMAISFIQALKNEAWPREPDIDGHCKKGWKVDVKNGDVTISPCWMIYHK